jgi:hypothetical protein
MSNRSVNTCTPTATTVREKAGMRAQTQSERNASSVQFQRAQSPDDSTQLLAERVERRGIGDWCCFDDDIQRHVSWQEILPDDFTQPSLQSVAIHRSVAVARHNDADSWKFERGSARPDREVPGSYNFPLLLDSSDVCAATDALRPREAQARFTRRRTWTEASRSDASDPSCDDDSALPDPSASTCACEIHASGFASCCGGDRWAFPWLRYVRQN